MKQDAKTTSPFQWLLDALQASAKRLHLGVPGPRNAELLELAGLSVRGIAALPASWRGRGPLDGSDFERGCARGRGECADSLEAAAAKMVHPGHCPVGAGDGATIDLPQQLLAVLLRDADDAHAHRVHQRHPEDATDDVMRLQHESLQARAQVRALVASLRECAEFLPDRGLPGVAKDHARRALEGFPDLAPPPPLADDGWIRVEDRLPETGDMVEVRARAAFAELRMDGAPLAHLWECSTSTISHWRVPQQEGETA